MYYGGAVVDGDAHRPADLQVVLRHPVEDVAGFGPGWSLAPGQETVGDKLGRSLEALATVE